MSLNDGHLATKPCIMLLLYWCGTVVLLQCCSGCFDKHKLHKIKQRTEPFNSSRRMLNSLCIQCVSACAVHCSTCFTHELCKHMHCTLLVSDYSIHALLLCIMKICTLYSVLTYDVHSASLFMTHIHCLLRVHRVQYQVYTLSACRVLDI
jgi:hypothetical protein